MNEDGCLAQVARLWRQGGVDAIVFQLVESNF